MLQECLISDAPITRIPANKESLCRNTAVYPVIINIVIIIIIIIDVYDKDHICALRIKNTTESDPRSYVVTDRNSDRNFGHFEFGNFGNFGILEFWNFTS